jgi:hypothetical protein
MVSSVTAVLLFLRVEERHFGVDLKGLDGPYVQPQRGEGVTLPIQIWKDETPPVRIALLS